MCLAIPGQVITIEGTKAMIEYPGQVRLAMIGDISTRVGEYVLVQMGIIVKVLSEDEARAALKAREQ